jgi:hypothetical protein
MTDILELADRIWNGDTDADAAHPVHARFPEGQEILEGVL